MRRQEVEQPKASTQGNSSSKSVHGFAAPLYYKIFRNTSCNAYNAL